MKKLSDYAKQYKQFLRSSISITIEGKSVYPSENYQLQEAEITLHISSLINHVDLLFNQIDDEKSFTSTFLCGSKIVISLGYQDEEQKVFTGYIHTCTWECIDQHIKSVRVYAQDVKGLMKLSTHYQYDLKNMDMLIADILKQSLYTTYIDKVKIDEITKSFKDMKFIQKEDDYAFMCYLAKLLHYDFYCDKDTLYFQKAYKNTQAILELDDYQFIEHVMMTLDVQNQMGEYTVAAYGKDYVSIFQSGKHVLSSLPLSKKMDIIIKKSKQYLVIEEMRDSATLKHYGEEESKHIKQQFIKVVITMRLLPDVVCGNVIKISINEQLKNQKIYIEKITHRFTKYTSITVLEGSIIE